MDRVGRHLVSAGLIAVAAAQTRRPAPLRWHRPDTTGWTVIDLDDHTTNPPGDTIHLGVAGGNFVVHQTVPTTVRTRFQSDGPANIAWIGGEIRIDDEQFDDTFDPYTRGYLSPMEAFHFDGDFRLAYLEGLLIHGDRIIEGGDIFNGYSVLIVVQNSRIAVDPVVLYQDTEQPDGITHSDCIQSWGGIAGMRIANSTMISTFQGGMFGDGAYPDQPIAMQWGYTELHRVNYASGRNTPETSTGRLLNLVQNDRLVGPIILDEVYADPRPRKWGLGDGGGVLHDNGIFWEGTDSVDEATGRHLWRFGQEYPSEGVWNADKTAEGSVKRGRPGGGDFCPRNVPGLNYRPPPNVVSEPFCIGGLSEANHLANRPVARTATDFLNGSTFVSRRWSVLTGPTAVGDLSSAVDFRTSALNQPGTYILEYELTTDSGVAASKMRIDVIAANPNWLINGKDFTQGLDEWAIVVGEDHAVLDTVGDEARILVTSNGSVGVVDRFANSSNATAVFPGETFTASVQARQLAGAFRNARIQATWINAGRAVIAQEDPESNVLLTGSLQTVAHTFTVPEGAAYVRYMAYFQGAQTSDEFRYKAAYLGDVVG